MCVCVYFVFHLRAFNVFRGLDLVTSGVQYVVEIRVEFYCIYFIIYFGSIIKGDNDFMYLRSWLGYVLGTSACKWDTVKIRNNGSKYWKLKT